MTEGVKRKDFESFVAGLNIDKFSEDQEKRILKFRNLSELERVGLMEELLSGELITIEENEELNNFHLAINDVRGLELLDTLVRKVDADPKLIEQSDSHVAGAINRLEYLPEGQEITFKLTPAVLEQLFNQIPIDLRRILIPYVNGEGVISPKALNLAAQRGELTKEDLELIVHSASEIGERIAGGRDKAAFEKVMTGDYSLESLMRDLAKAEARVAELNKEKDTLESDLMVERTGHKEYARTHALSNEEVNGLRATVAGHFAKHRRVGGAVSE